MANITALSALDTFFADLVVNLLDLPSDQVLISYEEYGQIHPKKGLNYCFVFTQEETDNVQMYKNRQDKKLQNGKWDITQSSMRKVKVQFAFYGDNSDTNALSFKEMLYFPTTNLLLDDNNLSLIPSEINLQNVREEINGTYWKRANLEVLFYNSVTFQKTVETIRELDLTTSIE